ncbi:MAG: TIGR02186 family protein [Alphaproteobacteria bacterium]
MRPLRSAEAIPAARWIWILVLGLAFFEGRPAAAADRLIADFSSHIIKIDQSFSGRRIHAFGLFNADAAQSEDGFLVAPPAPVDIVIVLKGPPGTVTVREKERLGGIWINRHMARFEQVPGFMSIVSTRPLDAIAEPPVQERHGLGPLHTGVLKDAVGMEREALLRDALWRLKRQDGLFRQSPDGVVLRGGSLFHAAIDLPSHVPVGAYSALVMAFQDGDIVAAQTIPLFVQKDGIETVIHSFAHDFPLLYGLSAVGAALMVGFAAASVARST